MLDFLKSYYTLRWTQTPQFHPLPSHITRSFITTPAGEIELLTSSPNTYDPNATPIFFVHGGNGHAAVWLEWMSHLSDTYGARTYAFSLRNHGASFAVPYFKMVWGTSFEDLVRDLVAAVAEARAREGRELLIVAHSSGGGLAQYALAKAMIKAQGLALIGAVPHFGNFQVYMNWFSRIDGWFVLRNAAHGFHPNSALNTDVLVRNAFFGHEFPMDRVRGFRRWMANYECMWWPFGMAGRGWSVKNKVWLDVRDILGGLLGWEGKRDKVMVMIGGEDRMMGGTEGRMCWEFREGIEQLQREKKLETEIDCDEKVDREVMDRYVTEERQGGVRLVEVKNAGHHTQNEVQWKEAAEALRRFAEQV